jgi:copper chaperone NosL
MRSAIVLALALLVGGCFEEEVAVKPAAVAMTPESVGYFCQMNVLEHDGPLAQIHLAGQPAPVWFTQIRDAVAFMRLPEETAEITAIYVSDMGRAESWSEPGADNFVDGEFAFYVIDSSRTGGMGAPEAVPFAQENDAREFSRVNGGKVVRLPEIPDAYVLSPVDTASARVPGEPDQ